MLPKGKKLTAEDLKSLKNKGKRVHTTLFSVVCMTHSDTRFAVSIPKKVYKLAYERNRARRRIYSLLSGISPASGWYEIILKSPIHILSYEELRREIEKIWQK